MAGSNGGPKRAAQVCESTVHRPGFAKERLEGTPQGGSLSPLLSNLDRELERRGHRFVRYADDVVIHVRSERAGQRVLDSVTRYVETALKLRASEAKSAVARPARRTFLGYRIDNRGELRISAKSRVRLIGKLRQLLRGARGRSPRGTIPYDGGVEHAIEELLIRFEIHGLGIGVRLRPKRPRYYLEMSAPWELRQDLGLKFPRNLLRICAAWHPAGISESD